MRKLLLLPITVLFLFSSLATIAQNANKQTGDNPNARDKFASEQEKDPALGYVPAHRLMNAIEHTEQLKAAQRQKQASRNNSSNVANAQSTPLTWIERGPIYDSVGPSNGNTRGGSTINYTSGRMRGFLLDTLNDPSGNTAFASGVAGGIWKCTNFLSAENNWVKINDRFSNLAISSICQDPTNPQIIYFSTGEPTDNGDRVNGGGVWKSTNGGTTFTFLASTSNYLRSFKIGCDAAGNVYLACRTTTIPLNQQSGLFRSTNGGTSWTDITPNNLGAGTTNSCTDFEFSASGNLNATFGYRGTVVNHRYTTSPVSVTPGTWLSGAGFRISNAPAIRTEMAVRGNILYAVTANTGNRTDSCYKSVDGGANWTLQNTVILPSGLATQSWYNLSLDINPANTAELITGGLDAYRSTDNGANWTRMTYWVTTAPYVHADHHFVHYWITGGQTRIIMGTDGGLFYSNDNGTTFNAKNKNIGIKQFYSAAIHPTAGSNYIMAGAQDNGVHAISNAGLTYSIEVTGGDGCIVHINQQNPLIQFGSYVGNAYRRSTNGGASWSGINFPNGLFVNPFDYDDAQNIMYCSEGIGGQLRRWDNANASNTSIVLTLSNVTGNLTSLKYSPHTANRLYFGTNSGRLFRLDNANTASGTTGASVEITGASFPAGTLICVNAGTNDNNLVATYTNYGINNVWVSTNGGTSWTAVDGDLPDMPVRWAMFEPGDNSKLFLATEAGIYTTTNINGASTVWLPETTFPTVSTHMIKIRASDSTIVAGTHGRGLWTAKIPGVVATNPNVTINQAAAQPDPTSASPINFTVVFDQPVINFTTGDVTLSGTAGATTATVTPPGGSGTTFNVAVTGMTTNGTVIATIAAGVCTNAALENNNASTSTDNTVTYNLPATPPTVTINQAAAQPDPASVQPINFTVVFDQPVTGFQTGDVTIGGTAGATTALVTGTGATYNVAVSGMTGCGTVIATIPAGVCQNSSAQTNQASTSTDNTVTFFSTIPTVTINQAAAQPDPTSASPIVFTAVFSEAVTGFATGDVTLSGTAGATLATVVPVSPTTYTINVTGMTGSGTVIATIAAGVCQNVCSAPNIASTSTDNTITYNAPPPCTNVNQVPNQTVCHLSATAAVNFTSGTPGTTFSWVNNNTSIGLAASGSGPTIASFIATNPTTAPVTATITVTPTLTTVTATTTTFNFTGGAQTFTVPAGVSSINITTLGAQGGTGATGGNGATGGPGGLGSRATGTLAVTPGQVLTIFVGGQGGVPTSGFNGGGTGGNANSGGGGGGSDVRFPGATSADRILVAGGGGGGGRAGCEPNTVNGGAGGNGDGNGANGVTSPNGGGGFGAIGTTPGAAGIGCAGFLGSPGLGGFGPSGGNGGAGQSCCCFTFASVPGGGGGGGGFLGGAGGGGGSAGTTGCLGNDKGGGGGGAGGTSSTSGVTAGVITTGIQTGNGQVVLNYNVTVVCTGPTMAFTITVNPTPAVDPIPNQVVCQNAPTAPVNFTGTPVGVVFQWTNNTPAIGLAASGTGNIPSFIAQNPTALPLVATITVTPVTGLATPIVTTYNFTGAVQTFTVPAGITSVNLKSWGAQGNSNAGGIVGGRGGYAEGNLTVVPGQVLNVYVGGGATTSINGGYNGGGNAGTNAGCAAAIGGGGGGASDVRIAPYALANRVIVGAGGGGAGGNRTAGCGRGTGGGGGGGLWGGGGGAGWPGVPPGGPVPTGGTQVAGGAAGVTTWTGGGPTNGFPGVLAVGGAGGIEVGSAQGTPTGPAEQGGVGGGLTGGAGLYNSANNWNGHSGAGGSSYIGGVSGGITTAGLRTGAGQVQVTYTPISAATCFGVARSFTITVNPNANLIIVADPGTTICEGDPTLLTVFDAGAVTAPGVLYTQGTTPVNGSPSQVFEPANAAFTSQGADNFTIPSGGLWNITQITANGIGAGVPTSVNVFFYANSGSNLPGAAIASMMNITTFVKVGGNYTVTLPSAVALGGGTYWMSFQVNMSFAAGGQWFWGNFGAANINQEYAWQNPGGGFATPCTAWGYGGTGCNVGGGPANRNNIFSIIGTSVGLGPQSTGTFLWSPALGLSSTTSNPVAASPMNTTTYTVVRTTVPGGCQASAMVTITVNKRPVVTAQPANIVRCVGNTATFTVGGTGTGLTYQWQLNTAGCGGGGTWTNLTNLAPYSGVTTATLTVNPVSGTMSGYGYRCVLSGTCTPFIPPTNVSNCATLTVNPNPNIAVTPVGPVCGGVMGLFGTALNVTSAAPPVPGNASANSGVIAVPIPDGSNVAATSNLTIAGIPANATLGEIRVNMNINHTWVGDVDVSLRAPNLAILNLVGSLNGGTGGNAGDNFTNTTFSSLGGTPISGAPDPRTGTFAAEARVGFGPIGFIQAAAATWANLAPPATPLAANGVWTLAAGDKVLTDVGTITNWSISIDYTTPGSGTQVLNYVWSPLAGLYTNTIANIPYAGTNLTTVYAAPTVQTTYTVRATDVATGCFSDASVLVNYTPPPPTITPSSVTMCLGDPAVRLVASSSTPGSATFSSGTVNVAIPDGPTIPPVPTSYPASVSNITVAGIPAGATITGVRARLNVTHAWVSDLVIALKAPNGQIVNLSALLNRTNQAGANFTNTVISSTSTTALGGAAPYTGTFADDAAGATFTALGFTFPGGPVGYVPTTVQYADLYNTGTTNGVWSLGIYDAGAPDAGTLNNWCIEFDYIVGVVASGAIWTPNGVGSGLFNDAAASSAYIGDRRDTVWARPTPIGANPYQVTVNNMISFAATPATPMAGGNGNNLISFNVRNNNAFPVTLAGISSNAFGSGAVAVRSFYKVTGNAGNPGPITAANGFVQFGTSNVTVTANTLNPVLTGLTLTIPAGATYAIALDYTGATFPAYTNGAATTVTYTNNGCDIITGGNVGWGGPAAPGTPVNNPRNFNGTVTFLVSGPGTCVSPPRTVIVTVNQPTVINANIPVNQTICTDKVATFSAAVVSGTGPHSYQWQVSTNSGVSFANVANGGVYSGATTATLTITAPPVSMSNYQYRCIITGAAPCAAQTSRVATLVVNPLPVIVISATAPRSLFPGLRSTFTSTVTPNPAGPGGYSWIRNGVVLSNPSPGVVSGLGTGSIIVDVDGQGDYQLRVTDVNGCTNISNTVTIKDSLNGKCFIYPNPTSGKFQVRYHSVANNVLPRTLTINDAKGDRVFTQRYTIGFPYERMEVDMRGFGKGMYWVEIDDLNGNRLAMCRVVVQ